jgi:hypothetical protein
MKLRVFVDERSRLLDVPDELIREAEDFFARMDQDMARGWRMGPEFVETPDKINRCQIAANKLLVALSTENQRVLLLMAGYILSRLPGVTGVRIDTDGEMLNTEFLYDGSAAPAATPRALTETEALEQVQRDISKVYRVGKVWKFATFDRQANRWNESPPMDSEASAEAKRADAVRERLGELLG